jgi:MoaA/NifB/PqqE/SkfB family radical SAM enzyme
LSVFEKNGPEKEMSTQQLKDAFGKLELMGVERINISGGEPFLRNDITDILKSAFQRRFKVSLTTNGILVPQYITPLKKLDLLIISLDGKPATHDFLRGKGVHAAVLKTLDICLENGIRTMISSVITAETKEDDLSYILKICEKFKISCLMQPITCGAYINNEWIEFKRTDELNPSYQHLKSLFAFLRKDSRRRRIVGGKYYLTKALDWHNRNHCKKKREFNCMAGKLFLCLSPAGKIIPCSMRYQDTIKNKIWESSVRELRDIGKNKIQCRGCACYTYMLLNDLSRLNPGAILHCLNSVN